MCRPSVEKQKNKRPGGFSEFYMEFTANRYPQRRSMQSSQKVKRHGKLLPDCGSSGMSDIFMAIW